MLNRQRILIIIAVVCSILTVFFWSHYCNGPINLSAYRIIKNGMSKAQIHGILGCPSDNKNLLIPLTGTSPPPTFEADLPAFLVRLESTWENWIGNKGTLVVLFDANGNVNGKAFINRESEELGFWEHARRFFGL